MGREVVVLNVTSVNVVGMMCLSCFGAEDLDFVVFFSFFSICFGFSFFDFFLLTNSPFAFKHWLRDNHLWLFENFIKKDQRFGTDAHKGTTSTLNIDFYTNYAIPELRPFEYFSLLSCQSHIRSFFICYVSGIISFLIKYKFYIIFILKELKFIFIKWKKIQVYYFYDITNKKLRILRKCDKIY